MLHTALSSDLTFNIQLMKDIKNCTNKGNKVVFLIVKS